MDGPSLQPLTDQLLKFDCVDCKLTDALGKLFNGHLIFVVFPTELLLVQVNFLEVLSLSC